MTEPEAIVYLNFECVAMLTEILGRQWVARLADDSHGGMPGQTLEAVTELCDAIRELTASRHYLRVDGRGCTCGWNGDDLLGHYVEAHQRGAENTVLFPVAIDKYDWGRPPGRLIKTWGDAGGLADEDIAAACDLPVDIYRGIVAGSEHITTEIAVKLEAGTHTFPANVWLMLERNYRAALVERARQPHH